MAAYAAICISNAASAVTAAPLAAEIPIHNPLRHFFSFFACGGRMVSPTQAFAFSLSFDSPKP